MAGDTGLRRSATGHSMNAVRWRRSSGTATGEATVKIICIIRIWSASETKLSTGVLPRLMPICTPRWSRWGREPFREAALRRRPGIPQPGCRIPVSGTVFPLARWAGGRARLRRWANERSGATRACRRLPSRRRCPVWAQRCLAAERAVR